MDEVARGFQRLQQQQKQTEEQQQQKQVSRLEWGGAFWFPSCCLRGASATTLAGPLRHAGQLPLGDHDVRGWCRSNLVLRGLLAGLGPAPLRLAATALPDAPKSQKHKPQDEPCPAQKDVPVGGEDSGKISGEEVGERRDKNRGEGGKDPSRADNDDAEDHACQAPLALAHHG